MGYDPINPIDPFDNYRVEGAGQRSPGHSGGEPPNKKWVIAAYFLNVLKKGFEALNSPFTAFSGTATEKSAASHLSEFKTLLEILKNENRSQDVDFLNRLSISWHKILEDSLSFKRDPQISSSYKALIKAIQSYPEREEHTLGYYFSEYAGQKWIPFPYMDLILKIHAEYQEYSYESNLSKWTRLIDTVVESLSQ
jgi:hypothetical protein